MWQNIVGPDHSVDWYVHSCWLWDRSCPISRQDAKGCPRLQLWGCPVSRQCCGRFPHFRHFPENVYGNMFASHLWSYTSKPVSRCGQSMIPHKRARNKIAGHLSGHLSRILMQKTYAPMFANQICLHAWSLSSMYRSILCSRLSIACTAVVMLHVSLIQHLSKLHCCSEFAMKPAALLFICCQHSANMSWLDISVSQIAP